jgi:hypothetical protein
MADRGEANKIMSGYYTKKWKNAIECKPIAYKLTLDSELHDMFALNVYCGGEGFSCDPESFETGPIEPTISVLDIMRKGVMVQGRTNNRNKRKLGIVYTGIDPLTHMCYRSLWRKTATRKICLCTDGLNYNHHWPQYVDVLNIIIRTADEVENLGLYREKLLSKLKKLDHIRKKRLVCRFTDETESCVMDTARMLQGGLNGWELMLSPNGVLEGRNKYGFEEEEWN